MDVSAFSISPAATSGADNKAYAFRAPSVAIASGNGSWAEVASLFLSGPKRTLTSYKADVLATVILELPTGCNKKQDGTTDVDQIGVLIRQQTAQGTAPTNRIAVKIEAQNTGTNRYSGQYFNTLQLTNPSGIAQSVLELKQLNTGATAGAHTNFDDKAGDPPSPVAGDLWRNGATLKYRKDGSTTFDLVAPITFSDATQVAANQGTTTTVLHGNAAGQPSFGAVALGTDVSGTLPIGSGGTGQTTAVAAFDALAPTTSAGDIIYYNGTDNIRLAIGTARKYLRVNSGATAPEWVAEDHFKTLVVESPTASENIPIFVADVAITVTAVKSFIRGATSVTFNLAHGTNPSSGVNLFTSSQTADTTTSVKDHSTGFNDATLAAGEAIWLTTSALSGTPTQVVITIFYTVD
jgi:hypothetical protein